MNSYMRRFLTGTAITLTLLGLGGCTRERQPDVILIVADTLRQDHVGDPQVTPFLEAWSRDAVVYSQCRSFSSNTNIAMAALWTGKLPSETGVLTQITPLPQKEMTLAESYRAAGYETVGVVANPVLSARKGFAQGFDHYRATGLGGDEVLAALRTYLPQRNRRKPLFLYVHLMDTHFPYNSADYARNFDPDSSQPFTYFDEVHRGERPIEELLFAPHLDEAGLARGRAHYKASVRKLDEVVATLATDLGETWRNARVVFTADHGESLGEHGYHFGHSLLTYDVSLHVPLVVKVPGRQPATVDWLVNHHHLHAELEQVLGGPADRTPLSAVTEHHPLHRAWGHPNLGQFKVNPFQPTVGMKSAWRSFATHREKLIVIPQPGGIPRISFFDLTTDPTELRDLGRDGLAAAKHRHLLLGAGENAEGKTPEVIAIDEEEREILRSLGYMGQ